MNTTIDLKTAKTIEATHSFSICSVIRQMTNTAANCQSMCGA